MYLDFIKMVNFRNYRQHQVYFHPAFNFLVGNNAQGKTNLIEAIYYLAVGKSHRTKTDRELIRWNSDFFYVRGDVKVGDSPKSIEIGVNKNGKIIRINGIELKKKEELLGNLSVVLFSPEELKLVKEGPSYRRKFIDEEIIQIKPSYFYILSNYNKILTQRNALLKEIGLRNRKKDTLDVWDKQLAQYGAKMIFHRNAFTKKLSILSRLMHRKITSGGEELGIKYSSCIEIGDCQDLKEMEEQLLTNLKNKRDDDIKFGTSSFGPHREDLEISINGIDARKFGSQGQQRTAALSMKLSELELVKGETGEYPVLLLDDVMSELDPLRQTYLVENLQNVQVFVTCTALSGIIKKRFTEGKVFGVDSGIITVVDI